MAQKLDITIPISTIWEPKEAGDNVRGFFRDRTSFQNSKYEKPVYLIGYLDGKCCAVNGDAVIERAFNHIPKGAFVSITFEGMENGKKYQYKSYDVQAWKVEADELKEFNSKVNIPLDKPVNSGGNVEPTEANQGKGSDTDDDLPF